MTKKELKNMIAECIVEEGMVDRLKARGAGIVGGAKRGLQGGAETVKSKITNDPTDKYNAAKSITLAKNRNEVAKIESYKKTAIAKLDKVANEIMIDLEKLGISKRGISAKQINFLKSALRKSLEKTIDSIPVGYWNP